MTLYTDNDPFCCEWLRELVAAGHLSPADVLCADINTLTHEQLRPYSTVHLFAGIGGWPLALQLAGWPTDVPVWTGSCPCQPFSCAGRGLGTSDPRHLWPRMRDLVDQRRPPAVFGEQVASRTGREWLAGVRADLEAMGYAVGASDLCAAGEGAPHIRQRLYWVAFSRHQRWEGLLHRSASGADADRAQPRAAAVGPDDVDGMAHHHQGLEVSPPHEQHPDAPATVKPCGASGRLEHSQLHGCNPTQARPDHDAPQGPLGSGDEHGQAVGAGDLNVKLANAEHVGHPGSVQTPPGATGRGASQPCMGSPWDASKPHPCLDAKTRRIPLEPAFFPLAHGLQPARVGILRGAGNAIVPLCAASFAKVAIKAVLDCPTQ